ncbi:hypothetical protein [Pseudomonas sp. GZD-209]
MSKIGGVNVQEGQSAGPILSLVARFGLMLAVSAIVLISAAMLMLQFAHV